MLPARFVTASIPTDATKYPYNHASCIAQLLNGDLLTVWVAGSAEAAKDTVILCSRRRPGESNWSQPQVIADKPDAGDANPTLLVDPHGAVWLFHVELFGAGNLCLGRVVSRTSSDNGETWSTPRPAFDAICTLVKNKPIITRSGRWVLPAYQEAIYQSQFWLSDDSGGSWKSTTALLTLPDLNLQPAVVELSDGSLFALMRCGTSAGITWQGRSKDCGQTWSLMQRPDLPNPNSGIDMTRLADGRLLLAFNPSTSHRTPLSVSISADEGMTWSSPRTIEAGQPQLSYPSIIQAKDGTIHCVYSHRLAHIQHVEFNPAWLDIGP